MSFDALGLSPELLRAVSDEGYTEPTPVQREAIPLVLARRDMLAGAQTGTGKTAAFVLPIIQILHETRVAPPAGPPAATQISPALRQRGRNSGAVQQASRSTPATSRPPIRVLVIVPTRELCIQVEESVRTYGARRPIKSTTIYGGVGFEPQAAKLRGGPEIVVATPGRLLDHVSQRTIDLSRVEILVLDEADRLLDMGFIRDIRRIIDLLPPKRQNLLFSATFSDDVRSLAGGILTTPAFVQVTPRNTTAELVEQLVIPVDRERKRDLLRELVALGRIDQALVFTRTKHGANRLAEQLVKDGINASAIHGNKSQSQRVKALTDFKEGRVAILVATDIAARGLDIEQLPHVVNFELPMVPEDYIHRIGRTGRAGTDGQAISLVCVDETPLLRDIQSLLRRTIPSEVIAGFEPDRTVRAEPIRLRSTPAERAMHAAARGGSGRGAVRLDRGGAMQNRGGAGSRGPAPARGAGWLAVPWRWLRRPVARYRPLARPAAPRRSRHGRPCARQQHRPRGPVLGLRAPRRRSSRARRRSHERSHGRQPRVLERRACPPRRAHPAARTPRLIEPVRLRAGSTGLVMTSAQPPGDGATFLAPLPIGRKSVAQRLGGDDA
jgi:ATP-dependent RNA helicase RhlE